MLKELRKKRILGKVKNSDYSYVIIGDVILLKNGDFIVKKNSIAKIRQILEKAYLESENEIPKEGEREIILKPGIYKLKSY